MKVIHQIIEQKDRGDYLIYIALLVVVSLTCYALQKYIGTFFSVLIFVAIFSLVTLDFLFFSEIKKRRVVKHKLIFGVKK
ncbi:MAG: hypothetical protein KKD48_00330 [Nanoarchaeota archaeon]|nr:hypothetical protein [Nanoarchaeota archaeon]